MGAWRARAAIGGLAIGLAACSGAGLGSAASSPGASAGAPGGGLPSGMVSASSAGVTLTVSPARILTGPGGTIEVQVALHNGRSTPVQLGAMPCGELVDAHADIPMPGVEPPGRTWAGVAADFKAFALSMPADQSTNFRGSNFVYAASGPCRDGEAGPTIAPGADRSTTLRWTADIVPGVPTPGLATALDVSVVFDPIARPTPDPAATPPVVIGSWVQPYANRVAAKVDVTVEGPRPGVLSAAQAIDSLLADPAFVAWLGPKPESTWSLANVFLRPAEDGLPAAWEIDLFREAGAPRTFAIGYMDALRGTLLKTDYCQDPCMR